MAPKRVRIGSKGSEPAEDLHATGDGEAGARGSGRGSPRSGRARRIAAIGGASSLALALIAVVGVRTQIDPDAVAAWVAPRASAALNRNVEVGEATVDFLPYPGVRVSNVRIGNLPAYEGPPLATVERLNLDVALLPVLLGRIEIGRARLHGAALHLGVDRAGTSNFGDLVPQGSLSGTTGTSERIRVALEEIELTDANITYFDARAERSFVATHADAHLRIARGSGGDWRVAAEALPDSVHMRMDVAGQRILRTGGPTIALSLSGDDSFDWVEVEEGRIERGDLSIDLYGRLDGLADASPRIDLKMTNPALAVAGVTDFVPTETRSRILPRAEGSVDVNARLWGPLDGDGPRLRSSLRLNRIGIVLGGEPVMREVIGRIAFGPDSIALDSLSGSFAGAPFTASGHILRDTRELALLLSAAPNLDRLHDAGWAPAFASLTGQANVDLAMRGRTDALDSLGGSGMIQLDGVRFGHDRIGVPVYVPSARLNIVDDEIVWTESTALLGEAPIQTEGRVRGFRSFWSAGDEPLIEVSVQGERIDLGPVLPRDAGEPEVRYPHIAFAHLGSLPVDGRRPPVVAEEVGFSRPRVLPVRGSVALEFGTLVYRDLAMDSVTAVVRFTDDELVVDSAAFDIFDGQVRASLRLGVGDAMDEPFRLTFEGERLDATRFLATMTPLGSAVRGSLEIEGSIEGSTDPELLPVPGSLGGGGRMTITDGAISETGMTLALADFLAAEEWRELAFTSWVTDFAVEERRLTIDEASLTSPLADASYNGILELSGALHLSMGLSIPPDRLGEVSLRRTGVAQSVIERLQASGDGLALGLRIAGSLRGPTVEPDALAATEAGVRRVRER